MTASRICCYVTLALVTLSGVAMAAADPVATAQVASDAGYGLVAQYGPLWGGMALVFGLASMLLERNKSAHWIAQGRTLAVIVAAVGVGGAALTAHFSGASWSGVAITGIMALFKLMEPTTISPSTNPVRFPVSLSLVLLLGVALAGCGVPAAAGHAVVDCTKADAAALEAAAVRLLSAPSWSALESEAIAAGETIGGCALLKVIDQYRAPKTAAAAPAPNPRDVIERVRAHFGGVTWQTASGPR